MIARPPLLEQTRALLVEADRVYGGTPAGERLREAARRLDDPLRVAIAGKVKAGKSTLLNALVGEEIAPTDAGECTKIVTWYRDGVTYRATLVPCEGPPEQASFSRDQGALAVDLAGHTAEEIERLEVEWPSASLRAVTLIDTPGIASLDAEVSQRTHAFLTPNAQEPTAADAVVYLMRHLHSTDVRFLESFHDEEVAQATPINTVGVLSRADEIGVCRLDSMTSAQRIAERYRRDPRIRKLCQTVVPIAGLLAQSGHTLREEEHAALARLASLPRDEIDGLLLSVDRLLRSDIAEPPAAVRERLVRRFGLFGVRLGVALIHQGAAPTSQQLADEFVARSGLDHLREVLTTQFAARRDVLKARSALLTLGAVLREAPAIGSDEIAGLLERVEAGAHEFAELRLLNAIRVGAVPLRPDEVEEAERVLGASGSAPTVRFGLAEDAPMTEVRRAATMAMEYWQRRAENPMTSRATVDAARVLIRTCEGVLATEEVPA
jgi:hypothetical protein